MVLESSRAQELSPYIFVLVIVAIIITAAIVLIYLHYNSTYNPDKPSKKSVVITALLFTIAAIFMTFAWILFPVIGLAVLLFYIAYALITYFKYKRSGNSTYDRPEISPKDNNRRIKKIDTRLIAIISLLAAGNFTLIYVLFIRFNIIGILYFIPIVIAWHLIAGWDNMKGKLVISSIGMASVIVSIVLSLVYFGTISLSSPLAFMIILGFIVTLADYLESKNKERVKQKRGEGEAMRGVANMPSRK